MNQSSPSDVFVNCPFDPQYKQIFDAIVFTVIRSGFRVRSALEMDDATENRFAKIQNIIGECRYSVHDISRTEPDGDPPLPRFNMPLELGVFIGAKRFGGKMHATKRALILDTEQYRYQRFISDIAGQDIRSHNNDVTTAITEVAAFLRSKSGRNVPGGAAIAAEYEAFRDSMPDALEGLQLLPEEVTFSDYMGLVVAFATKA